MNRIRRTTSRALPGLLLAAVFFGAGPSRALAAGVGHGGGAGHIGAYRGPGWHGPYAYGFHGYGHPYYRYPYYGYGYGLGFGLGLGLGYGLGYGYPYYGYGYGYPAYGYPYYGSAYSYPGPGVPNSGAYPPPGPGVANPGAYPPPGPVATPAVPAAAVGTARAAPPASSADTDVTLVVRVPTDAVVWINGLKTYQTGFRREFVSSGPAPGQSYTYFVRARWTSGDGRPTELDRRISVRAGERRVVDFAEPDVLPAEIAPVPAAGASR